MGPTRQSNPRRATPPAPPQCRLLRRTGRPARIGHTRTRTRTGGATGPLLLRLHRAHLLDHALLRGHFGGRFEIDQLDGEMQVRVGRDRTRRRA